MSGASLNPEDLFGRSHTCGSQFHLLSMQGEIRLRISSEATIKRPGTYEARIRQMLWVLYQEDMSGRVGRKSSDIPGRY